MQRLWGFQFLVAGSWLLLTSPAFGWMDAAWPLRRPVDVAIEADKWTGNELVVAEFYTAGRALPDGADVRVAGSADRVVPSKVLTAGPGDRLRVVFAPLKGEKRYYVYFGNPTPPPPKAGTEDVKPTSGLLMEMRRLPAGGIENFQQIEQAWGRAQLVIGRTMLDKAFIGINPFTDEQGHTISRFDGTLQVQNESKYNFAMAANDRGAIFIDGKPVLFANAAPADTRINADVTLTKGPHAVTLYHANVSGAGRISVVWSFADSKKYQLLDFKDLGRPIYGTVGQLEELRKTLVADFTMERGGEAFFANHYSHRFTFAALQPKIAAKATFEWDFGDGQTATGPSAQHVYLVDGIYTVRLTARVGANSDVNTTKLHVSRDWAHIDRPQEDPVGMHANLVGSADLSKVPEAWLARAAMLFLKAEAWEKAVEAAARTAGVAKHEDVGTARDAVDEVCDKAIEKGQSAVAVRIWQKTPADSDLQPHANLRLAELLLWRVGDFAAATQLLQPMTSGKDDRIKRMYAHALLLSGKPKEAAAILQALPVQPPANDPNKQPAISGAAARTVEFYLTKNDWEAGEAAWEQWQARLPADFLQGYGVLLRVRLLEAAKSPESAAKIAEAFAIAMPNSSYSPQLLDRASKLLATADPGKSAALRKLLKERYPEDPLAQ